MHTNRFLPNPWTFVLNLFVIIVIPAGGALTSPRSAAFRLKTLSVRSAIRTPLQVVLSSDDLSLALLLHYGGSNVSSSGACLVSEESVKLKNWKLLVMTDLTIVILWFNVVKSAAWAQSTISAVALSFSLDMICILNYSMDLLVHLLYSRNSSVHREFWLAVWSIVIEGFRFLDLFQQ